MEDTPRPVSIQDYEERARELLPKQAYDYYAGGAEDERTIADNRAAFSRFVLRPRVLVDVAERDLSTTLLGTQVSVPIIAAPTALHRMAHPDGEVETARGLGDVGALMILSSLASRTMEDVAEVEAARWFQLYVQRDSNVTAELVKRADASGYGAIVLTVDLPVAGARDRDARNAFTIPEGMGYANLPVRRPPPGEHSDLAKFIAHQGDASLNWEHVPWLRSLTDLPFVLKGVIRAEDAARAVEAGFEGIVVSNHGGRQLDGTVASIEALPEAVEAVAGRAEVYVDGGVRRGSDVLKALALGARAVLVGRPPIWGLAVAGRDGVRHVMEILRAELDIAMAIAGCPSISDVTADLVARRW